MASEAGLFVEWFGKLAKKKKRAKSTAITAQRNDISASPAYSNNRQQRYASSNTGKIYKMLLCCFIVGRRQQMQRNSDHDVSTQQSKSKTLKLLRRLAS